MPLKPNAYPPPPPFTYPIPAIHPILPVYPPPPPTLSSPHSPSPTPSPPPLPTPQRAPAFLSAPDRPYHLTTHLVPASYLRTTRHVPLPVLPPPLAPGATPEEKQARKQKLIDIRELLDDVRGSKSTDGYPCVLWNCVNRYARVRKGDGDGDGGRKGLTLFFAHANGFPKEIFEPTISHLLSSDAQDTIDEIWVWESIQHGDSALVNKANLSALFDWHDNARDILNFLLYFLPSPSESSSASALSSIQRPEHLPTHLPKIPEDLTRQRLLHGFIGTDDRRLVVIGHSYGGCSSALAATIQPSLFTALYLIDPVIIEPRNPSPSESEQSEKWNVDAYKLERNKRPRADLAMGALSRRDGWDSREQAHAAFLANPFFAAWDPDVLKVYVECGLHASSLSSPSPSPSTNTTQTQTQHQHQKPKKITLKTRPILEASVFAEVHTAHEAFHLLSFLPAERVSVRWCMPGKEGTAQLGYGPVEGMKEEERREVERGIGRRVWVRRGGDREGGEGEGGEGEQTTNVRVRGGGHLIPQEAPKELAEDLGAYLTYMYPRWIRPNVNDGRRGGGEANASRLTIEPPSPSLSSSTSSSSTSSSSSALKANL